MRSMRPLLKRTSNKFPLAQEYLFGTIMQVTQVHIWLFCAYKDKTPLEWVALYVIMVMPSDLMLKDLLRNVTSCSTLHDALRFGRQETSRSYMRPTSSNPGIQRLAILLLEYIHCKNRFVKSTNLFCSGNESHLTKYSLSSGQNLLCSI